MYVIISLITLTAALTANLCLGPMLQARFQLLGTALTQLIFLLCALLGSVAMILAARRHPSPRDEALDLASIASLRTTPLKALVGGLLLCFGGSLAATLCTSLLGSLFPEAAQGVSERYLAMLGAQDLSTMLVTLAAIPAVCEELLFRGLIQHSFERHASPRYAVIATALLFAAFHLSPIRFPGTFFMGLLMGYALTRSGSILVPMAIHYGNNAMAVHAFAAPSVPLSAPILGIASLAILAVGAALLEDHPIAALRRHWVTAAVIAAAVAAMTAAVGSMG